MKLSRTFQSGLSAFALTSTTLCQALAPDDGDTKTGSTWHGRDRGRRAGAGKCHRRAATGQGVLEIGFGAAPGLNWVTIRPGQAIQTFSEGSWLAPPGIRWPILA